MSTIASTVTQTPIVLAGTGPFTLTGDMFATSLTAALVLRDSAGQGDIIVTLPSTSTIAAVMTNTNVIFGAWVKLKLINLNTIQNVVLVPADGATTITQNAIQPLTSGTYTIYELAPGVKVVQDLRLPLASEYLTVLTNQDLTLPSTLNFAFPFTNLQDQSQTSAALSYNVASNYLQVSPGVTALISVVAPIVSIAITSFDTQLVLAPALQSATVPLTGMIAGSYVTVDPDQAKSLMITVVYTNNTTSPTLWQAYLTNFGASTLFQIYPVQLTATQIVYK